jgi:hypothetical protein
MQLEQYDQMGSEFLPHLFSIITYLGKAVPLDSFHCCAFVLHIIFGEWKGVERKEDG